MAISKKTLSFTSSLKLVSDINANATAEANINSGAATLYGIRIDNSLDSAANFVKLYNNVAPTVGTTVPDIVVKIGAGRTRHIMFPKGIAFGTAISFACVTTGGTAGTTNPVNTVKVYLLIT